MKIGCQGVIIKLSFIFTKSATSVGYTVSITHMTVASDLSPTILQLKWVYVATLSPLTISQANLVIPLAILTTLVEAKHGLLEQL